MSIKICVVSEGMYIRMSAFIQHRTANNNVLRAGAVRPSVAGPAASLDMRNGPGFHLFGVRIRTSTNQGVRVSIRSAIRVGFTKSQE